MKIRSNILKVLLALGLVLLLNWAAGRVQWRLDLSEEKRFTLADITKNFLKDDLTEDLHITIYLDGSVNSGFRRLEKATLGMVKQFHILNKKHISYTHIQVEKLKPKEKHELVSQLKKMDMAPMNIIEEDANGNRSEKAVYPWAVVAYKGHQRAVKLLVNINNRSGEQNLNSSIEALEYKFTEAIRLLSETQDRRVAFLEGHGELDETETYDITTALSQYYSVDRGRITTDAAVLNAYEAVIIANPNKAFNREEKYVLDQYLMQGGKLLCLVDGVKMSMDSLTKAEKNYGIYNDINVGDMLFRYGVRINPDLVQDMQCARYPVNVSGPGEPARFQPLPWFYAPLLMPNVDHPITKNVANVKSEFTSTIDLVGDSEKIKKTVLLSSSPQSRVMAVPMQIDLGESVKNLSAKDFNAGSQIAAVLLEGEFPSLFAHRGVPPTLHNTVKQKKESVATKMIVIADGDIIRNGVRGHGDAMQIVPLGYDYATNQAMFGNKDFLLNAMNYLTDDKGWYTLRQRSLKLRLLDKKEMERRYFYRVLNVALPLLLMLLLALVLLSVRKNRFAK